MDFDYFIVSQYITVSIAAITIPIFIVRLFRTFPFYVKNGHVGKSANNIMLCKLSNLEECKKTFHKFLTETHPLAIFQDVLSTVVIGFILSLAWMAIPPIAIGWFIFWCIIKLAKHMREQYVKKEEFVAKLDGTYEGDS